MGTVKLGHDFLGWSRRQQRAYKGKESSEWADATQKQKNVGAYWAVVQVIGTGVTEAGYTARRKE